MDLRKVKDMVIYSDEQHYSSFPSVICRPDGRLVLAFRRAPERRTRPGGSVTHSDPNSWLVQVVSDDSGETWSEQPTPIFIHPRAGNQDPCLMQLADGTLLCSTFSWELLCESVGEYELEGVRSGKGGGTGWWMMCLGGSVVRSDDGGDTWSSAVELEPVPSYPEWFAGAPNRPYCRGRMCELDDGTVLLPAYCTPEAGTLRSAVLYRSADRGESWQYFSEIASDATVKFGEPTLHMTAGGKLMAFMRTADMDGYLAVAHSVDGGKSFSQWERTEVWGHPFTTATVPDGRILLAYGYRREPFGIRCRLLEPECEDLNEAEELVIRDDGGGGDLGYPWAARMADDRMLVVYYMSIDDGTRHIAGSVIDVG
jgi:sialidase-1